MKAFTLIALLGVAAANDHLDAETKSALSQMKKNFENEVQDAEYPEDSMVQLDVNINNKILIDAQNKVANREVPTSGLLQWDDMEKTGTELDLDDGEEDIKADATYTDADLETVRLSQNVQINNKMLVDAEQRMKEREEETDEGLVHMGITDY